VTERPADLFRLAESCNLAADLSRAFLRIALRDAVALPGGLSLFCNLHPDEIAPDLPSNIDRLVASPNADGRTIVVEIPESAKADAPLLRDLSVHLHRRKMQMAFDDFGRGQSRLASLPEAPPDYIKIDRQLVHDIDKNPRRRDVVRAIANAARDLQVTVIAEGLERPEELEACRDLGCHWGQGFLLGHPESIDSPQDNSSVSC
jgi:EAL domain-containing protein (putative c-di-GMP-specific phosphodiesterase class I)